MSALNLFNVGINEIEQLTPRRRQYIQQRNVAQDQRIDNIADSILNYKNIIKEARARYSASEPKDQSLIKPYLTILYFELGQLLETQAQLQEALRYYEQAGIYGHLISIECAKRLGSKHPFVLAEKVPADKWDSKRDISNDKLAIFDALHKSMIRIENADQKGSGVLAKHDTLGNVLITAKHVAVPGAIAHMEGQEISLDSLEAYYSGPNVLFILDDLFEGHDTKAPTILTNGQLKIGEKVYFGGYPFKKTAAYLHIGRVSSIEKNGEFSIDGAAVPGMSGGPVAVEREGKLYVIGTIGSETFDPIEGFSKALDEMYFDQANIQTEKDWVGRIKKSILETSQKYSHLYKIPRNALHIAKLDCEKVKDPTFFDKIWDDLNKKGIISDDGDIEPSKIIPGQLGLREEFQQYEGDVIHLLRARTRIKPFDVSRISLSSEYRNPTSSVNTVSLSLVQSLSTGLITGHLFQGFSELVISLREEEPTEFAIGRKKLIGATNKILKKEANKVRTEAKESGTFVNTGLPDVLFRFVSKEDAKLIKENGIEHLGTNLDEIPFLTQPDARMAQTVGARSIEKMVTIFSDLIPNISAENVRKVSERNGVVTYRINVSIPREAIRISAAQT